MLREADRARISRYIHRIITDTDYEAKKTLFEALVDVIEVQSDGSVIPTFKVRHQRRNRHGAPTIAALPASTPAAPALTMARAAVPAMISAIFLSPLAA